MLLISSYNNSYPIKSFIENFKNYFEIDTLEINYKSFLLERIVFKITKWKYFCFTTYLENLIINKLKEKNYKYLFLIKSIYLKETFYKKIKQLLPNIKIIGLTYDYLGNFRTSSINLNNSLKYYNYYFAPQKHYLDFIKSKGCKNVYKINFSVSDELYKLAKELYNKGIKIKYDVVIVANYEKERAELCEYLLENNISLKIVGNNWYKAIKYPNILKYIHKIKPLTIEEVLKITMQSKIVLGVLRKAELDLITARTFEIPAFYGYMIHEDNEVVRDIFKKENFLDYFNSKEELKDKIINYLNNFDEEIHKIKIENAHKYIQKKKYLTSDDVNKIVKVLDNES